MEFFDEFEIIGGIVPNLIAFSLFLGAIGYFTLTEKMAEMFGIRKRPKSIRLVLHRLNADCYRNQRADLGQPFSCEKGTDRGFPDSFVKIMYQRFLITLPSAYIHHELNDLNAR